MQQNRKSTVGGEYLCQCVFAPSIKDALFAQLFICPFYFKQL